MEKKVKDILSCLDQRDVDLWKLREYAISEGGLVNSEWKKSFCLILFDVKYKRSKLIIISF